ncbi:MAG: thioether cross-link-forming SCIFF peptide maturase [Oscillospiraceae bacterium]|nr:thioether cross-link-forming SCIFF peptide maturase [Oscillospiraceae bacterium]
MRKPAAQTQNNPPQPPASVIHAFELLGKYFALDVPGGSVHSLDAAAYKVVRGLGSPPGPTPPPGLSRDEREAWAELFALRRAGLLFTEDTVMPPPPPDTPLKAICLHVAHDCNLRCAYCFAEGGSFGAERGIMPPEVGIKAVDYLLSRCASRRHLEIDFFGGEPLLAIDTVKSVVNYCNKHSAQTFRFTITTNGLLLDEDAIAFINATMDNVVLSLDGNREVNDALRRTPEGEGSYDLALPNFKRLLKDRKGDCFVRGTFTAAHPRFADSCEHLRQEGFTHISVEPAVLPPGHPLALTPGHLPGILDEYERLAARLIQDPDFSFFHFQVDFEQGPCAHKRAKGCGAGYEYAAVTPSGNVYPCHQFVGNNNYLLGNVLDGTFDKGVSDVFRLLTAERKPSCSGCWAKYFCSGGCHASNLIAEGDLAKSYTLGCEMEKKRLECAILLNATE